MSIKKRTKGQKFSTTVNSLIKKAEASYQKDDFTSALNLSDKAFKKATANKDYNNQVRSLLVQMKTHMSAGDAGKAKRLAVKITKLAANKCSVATRADALIQIGYLHMQYLEYATAESMTVEALIIARDNDNPALQADALVQLASLDSQRRQNKEALVYLREALRISEPLNEPAADHDTYIERGRICGALGEYDRALETFEHAESLAVRHGRYDWQVESILNQGDIFRSIGDFDKAERLYDAALDIADNQNVSTKTTDIFRRVGILLLHTGDYRKALEWYRMCEKKTREFKSQSYFPFIRLGMGTAYNGLEDYKRAVSCFRRVLDIIAPDYFPHGTILHQTLTQLALSFDYLNQAKWSNQVKDMADKIGGLIHTGIDEPHQTALFVKKLQNELNILIESLKKKRITVFSRDGVRVDLRTGEIYREGKLPSDKLSRLQLEIFRLLVKHEGKAVTKQRIIGCYEEYVDDLQELPRRAHYFIREIRKKLGRKRIIKTVTGIGYKIPRL